MHLRLSHLSAQVCLVIFSAALQAAPITRSGAHSIATIRAQLELTFEDQSAYLDDLEQRELSAVSNGLDKHRHLKLIIVGWPDHQITHPITPQSAARMREVNLTHNRMNAVINFLERRLEFTSVELINMASSESRINKLTTSEIDSANRPYLEQLIIEAEGRSKVHLIIFEEPAAGLALQ